MSEREGRRPNPSEAIPGALGFDAPEGGRTAELVGWASLGSGTIAAGASRTALAEALDVHPDEIRDLSEDTVRRALQRLRSLAAQANRLATEADTDDLTGALRRGAGMAAISREIARVRRGTEPRLCVAFADVDGLKQVNDTLGHPEGDRLLRGIVALLRERLRAYDLIVRYGGDEFVIALPGLDTPSAGRLFAQFETRLAARTGGGSVTIGLAELDRDDDVTTIVARADAALVAQRTVRRSARPT